MQGRSEKKPAATEELVPLVYQELRAIAHHYFRNQRPGLTLRPTDVVNEACLHLIQRTGGNWQGPEHFRAVATKKIWQVLVDHLRRRRARKRGGPVAAGAASAGEAWQRVPLDAVVVEWRDRGVELLDLADALDALGTECQRPREVVMLHWFGGLTYAEVAGILSVSTSTVEKDFRYALAWLNRRLAGAGGHAD
jgi:RNA polymerase sigma-70 factor, ECF subfamily